jgi:hypothetical protein
VEYLAATDARCPVCRYQLRGGETSRCPECGWLVALELREPHTARGWWLMAVFGSAISTMMALAMLVPLLVGLTDALPDPRLAKMIQAGVAAQVVPPWPAIITMTSLTLGSAVLLAWLLVSRRAMVRWWWGWRVSLALVAALSPLILLRIVAWVAMML